MKCVVSIDIGTSCSGFAFSNGTDQIHTNATQGVKIPTILLLKLPSLEFVAFGPDAKQVFDDASIQDRKKYLYFTNFKMNLYDANHNIKEKHDEKEKQGQHGNSDAHIPMIQAKNNHSVPVKASIIFKHCVRYMVEKAMDGLKGFGASVQCKMEQVKWILTVPSIWNLAAKNVMKQAGIDCGIPESQLSIMIESEAAAVYCRNVLDLSEFKQQQQKQKQELQYKAKEHTFLVIDLGGGTADFTVHKTVDAKHTNVVEVVAPSGGPWGGATINHCFEKFLVKLFGEQVINRLQYETPHAFLELEQSFEQLKTRTHHSNMTGVASSCFVRLPPELISLVPALKTEAEIELSWYIHTLQQQQSQQIVTIDDYLPTKQSDNTTKSGILNKEDDDTDQDQDKDDFEDVGEEEVARFLAEHKTNVWFHQGKLKFSWATMLSFFSDVLVGIEEHTKRILSLHPSIETAFLVGGFSQSSIVRDFLHEHVFKEASLTLHVPREPQQAVLFGAVMYGNRPRQIQSRIAQRNYGIASKLVITKKNRELYQQEFKDVPRRLNRENGKITKCLENIYLPLCSEGEVMPIATEDDFKTVHKDERVWKMIKLTPSSELQTSLTIHVYESKQPHRRWMSPEAMSKKEFILVGSVRVELQPVTLKEQKERELRCWFYFGDHEIKTYVADVASGKVEQSVFALSNTN